MVGQHSGHAVLSVGGARGGGYDEQKKEKKKKKKRQSESEKKKKEENLVACVMVTRADVSTVGAQRGGRGGGSTRARA